MLIKIQHTTLLQIFHEFAINSKVIFKSKKGADNTLKKNISRQERVKSIIDSTKGNLGLNEPKANVIVRV